MTKTEAIRIARSRISIVGNGPRQWIIHRYSPQARATYVSHSMDIWRARATYRERVLREALELLEIEEADEEAFVLAQYEGYRWTDLVGLAIERDKAA